MSNLRESLNTRDAKVIAIDKENHRQIKSDYRNFQLYTRMGWRVYAIKDDGIFFFLDNRDNDGMDWCKIASETQPST